MKIIDNPSDFELLFTNTFGDIDRSTLYGVEEDNALGIELGGRGNSEAQRLKQAFSRGNKILQYCFGGKSIWLRIILWTDKEQRNLADAGFSMDKATKVFKQKEDYETFHKYETLYIHFNRYSKLSLSPLTKSNINYDSKVDPCAQITCYYIDLDSKLIINIYDDRGLVIYSPNKELLMKIKNKFRDWLL